jgi:hypothetical protein
VRRCLRKCLLLLVLVRLVLQQRQGTGGCTAQSHVEAKL